MNEFYRRDMALICAGITAVAVKYGTRLITPGIQMFQARLVLPDLDASVACTIGEDFTSGTWVELSQDGGEMFFVQKSISSVYNTLDVRRSKNFDEYNARWVVYHAVNWDTLDEIDRVQHQWNIKNLDYVTIS